MLAAARAIGRTLDAAGIDRHGLAALVSVEAARQAAPAFTFATTALRTARKLMVQMVRQTGARQADCALLERLSARLFGASKNVFSDEEIGWLDRLWWGLHGMRHKSDAR